MYDHNTIHTSSVSYLIQMDTDAKKELAILMVKQMIANEVRAACAPLIGSPLRTKDSLTTIANNILSQLRAAGYLKSFNSCVVEREPSEAFTRLDEKEARDLRPGDAYGKTGIVVERMPNQGATVFNVVVAPESTYSVKMSISPVYPLEYIKVDVKV